MTNSFDELLRAYLDQLDSVAHFPDHVTFSYAGIDICRKCLQQLKEKIVVEGFADTGEEVRFFKHIKPAIAGQLVFYKKVCLWRQGCTVFSREARENYIRERLEEVELFFRQEQNFIAYIRSGADNLDLVYFTRAHVDWRVCPADLSEAADPVFTTVMDQAAANLMAHDLLRKHLERWLAEVQCENMAGESGNAVPHLRWTGSKIGFVELVYALHSAGCLNNGQTGIGEVIRFLGKMFHIDPGDYYHKFMELRMRKINPTKFLDQMREGLLKRMEETDEAYYGKR